MCAMQHKQATLIVGAFAALTCGAGIVGCGGGGGNSNNGAARPMLGVNGRIVIPSSEDGFATPILQSFNPDGTDVRTLVRDSFEGSISADGKRLAYVARSVQKLAIANADGSNARLTPLANSIFGQPVWSPDGTRIAVNVFLNNGISIATVKPDGTDFRVVSRDAQQPSYSPDGKRIVFSSTGTEKEYPNEICIVNADGSNRRFVVRRPRSDSRPKWSPDGRRIIFDGLVSGGFTMLFTVAPNGSNLRALNPTGITNAFGASFSPDGRKILFYGGGPSINFQLLMADSDGTDVRSVLPSLNSFFPTSPFWSTVPITTPPFSTPPPTPTFPPIQTPPPPF